MRASATKCLYGSRTRRWRGGRAGGVVRGADKQRAVLTEGGRSNSPGRAGEVVDAVLADRGRLDELWACIGRADAYVRMRAVDSCEKVVNEQPTWADPYVPRILGELTASRQPSIQWHIAQLFPQGRLADDQRERAIAWLMARLATTRRRLDRVGPLHARAPGLPRARRHRG